MPRVAYLKMKIDCIYDDNTAEKAARAAVTALKAAGLIAATAESCTGGLISKLITDVPGASVVFAGGIVSYSNEMKERILGVPTDILIRHDAVSEPTALEMARGARRACGADVAVSATGIAGPGGGTSDKPVGTVWVAVSCDVWEEAFILNLPPHESRTTIRRTTAVFALYLLAEAASRMQQSKSLTQ